MLYRIAVWIFALWFAHVACWFTGHRRRINANLKRIYPEWSVAKRWAVGMKSARTIGLAYGEMLFVGSMLRELRDVQAEGPGLDAFRKAAASGRPCILASAHYGNHFATIPILKANGIEAAMLYRRVGNRILHWIFTRALKRFGQKLFQIGRRQDKGYQRNLALLARHLKNGGNIGVILDQRVTTGAQLKFMGRTAWTSLSLAELAVKYDAVFIPGYAARGPDGRYRLVMEKPIPTGDPRRMMQRFNTRVSDWIRDDPGLWFWNIKRW